MLCHHVLDILIVMTLEKVPQLISVAKYGFRYLPHLVVSCPADNLGDRWQNAFRNLDNLRPERSPNGLRDEIAGTNESFEGGLDAAEIGLSLPQSDTGACYLPSPEPNDGGDSCRGGRHNKDQQQRVHHTTSNESSEEAVNRPK